MTMTPSEKRARRRDQYEAWLQRLAEWYAATYGRHEVSEWKGLLRRERPMARVQFVGGRGGGNAGATMSAPRPGTYLHYFFTQTAKPKIIAWDANKGVALEFDTDDTDGQPVRMIITPATTNGLHLLKPKDSPTHLAILTSMWGRAIAGPAQPVEEVVNEDSIEVSVPFKMTKPHQPSPSTGGV
jgi:hypothetical protein